jgi:release factor glutamine methyltransferase
MIAGAQSSSASLASANGATIGATLARAAHQLRARTDTPRLEAELLLAHVLGLSRASLHTHPERPLLPHQQRDYQTLLSRRIRSEPLPYLTGHVEFYGLDLIVDARVLIPRPETETLVDLALSLIHPHAPLTLADVGTGSGCIAIALAVGAPHAYTYALDLSPDALAVAYGNAERHEIASRVTFLRSDLLTALPQPVDLIVANLPYVAADEWDRLPREVRAHEPRLALYGGRDGLNVIRRLLDEVPTHLRPGGALLIEVSATQGATVTHLARRTFPTAAITLHTDLASRDRVLCVQTHPDGERDGHP